VRGGALPESITYAEEDAETPEHWGTADTDRQCRESSNRQIWQW
jgi:hypothetical protein